MTTIEQSFTGVDNGQVLYCQLCGMEFSTLKTKMAHFCGKPHSQELVKKLCDVLSERAGVGEREGERKGERGGGSSERTLEWNSSSLQQQQEEGEREGGGREVEQGEKELGEEMQSSCSSDPQLVDGQTLHDLSLPCVESSRPMETCASSHEENHDSITEEMCLQADSCVSDNGRDDRKVRSSAGECARVTPEGEVEEDVEMEDCDVGSDEGQSGLSSPPLEETAHLNPEEWQSICSNLDEYLLQVKGEWNTILLSRSHTG